MSPDIGEGGITPGKTYAVGFWDSEDCNNSLASFPDGIDFSWGVLSFNVNGCNEDNYVEVKILNLTNSILQTFKYITNGKKEIDLSQYENIPDTQDVKIRIEITTFV